MKILGLIIIALTASTTNMVYASNSIANPCTATVIETNSGQFAYVVQIDSSKTQIQLDFDASRFRISLASEKITDQDGKSTALDYDVVAEDGTITLTIIFDSYQRFYDYNGIDLTNKQNRKIETKKSLFFNERTITLSDPYTRFFDTATNKAAAILQSFNNEFNETDGKEIEYKYVFASSFRRTETNSDKNSSSLIDGIWEYKYDIDASNPREIIIFDRFQNSPMWYVVAATATLVFMGVLYLVLKQLHKKNKVVPQKSN